MTRRSRWFALLETAATLMMIAASGMVIWTSVSAARSAAGVLQPRSPMPELPLPADPISVEGAPYKGSLSAPFAIIEYADFH